MKQRFAIALLTIVVLAAGYYAGRWAERTRCKVPPPPPSLLNDSAAKKSVASKAAERRPEPVDVSYLLYEIGQIGPQIEDFRKQMDAIDSEMDHRIDAILRPDQRPLFQELVRRGEMHRADLDAERTLSTPLTEDEIRDLQEEPLQRLLTIIVVPIRVYWNTRQLKLDETQSHQLEQILKWRRDQFIALVDKAPPSSLAMSTLAPLAQRLPQPRTAVAPAK